ncbi:MAG: hypothetical protein COB02_16530 [Candidatus Cloacimonadota bacterium]|nr:MAG: hypothetical protein COB02_16530 [Candidatus Cloacimonadota bacterium]
MYNYLFLFLLTVNFSFSWSGITPSIRYFRSNLTGSFKTSNGIASTINKTSNQSMGVDLRLHILGTNLRFRYEPLSYRTKLKVQNTFDFQGQSFLIGDQLNFDLKMNSYDFQYGLSKSSFLKSSFYLGSGLNIIETKAKISGTRALNTLSSASSSKYLPMPYLVGNASYEFIKGLSIFTEYRWLDFSMFHNKLSSKDFEIGFKYHMNPLSAVSSNFFVGYKSRSQNLSLDYAGNQPTIDLNHKGFLASYDFRF